MEKRPRDERRAILKAAEAIIAVQGFTHAEKEDVIAKARVSAAVFDENFQDMHAVLRALSLAFVEQMNAATDQSTHKGIWAGAAARDVVEVAVRSILDVVIERGALVREILSAAARDDAFAEDLRQIGTHLSKRLIAVMSECTNVPVRPSRALAFSLLLTVALAHHYVLVGDQWSGLSFTKEQLTEETARAVCAYLGLSPTIKMLEDGPDVAPTEMVEAIHTDEILAARASGGPDSSE